ncbi:thiamineS protein [Methanoregula boonei 6A8]|uniref:ThiamineS protein n=2 Tax=Methanoregula TaxID=395331 RepID=A7IA73_METB6|nr:thiamineS protein [Methanoregula boonei 6A8]
MHRALLPSFRESMRVLLPDQGIRVIDWGPGTVAALLQELGINPLEVMVARNGALVPEQAAIGGDDEIRIIRIAHGG